jgi:hypothetical protein
MARYEELTIDQGSDVSLDVYLTNVDGSPKDLSGFSAAAKMSTRYDVADSDKIAFTAYVTVPTNAGIVNLSLPNTTTSALNSRRRYVYDMEISYTDSDSNVIVERVLEGLITVTPSVT